MNVIERNFMRLLRCGTFGDDTPTEPMSHWKWDYLFQMSMMHGVPALVYDGIKSREGEFFLNITDRQRKKWKETVDETERDNRRMIEATAMLFDTLNGQHTRPIMLKGQALASIYNQPLHRQGGDCDIFFPLGPQWDKAGGWARHNGGGIVSPDHWTLQYEWHGLKVEHHRRMLKLTNILFNKRLQNIIDAEIRCCDSTYIYINNVKIETLPPTLNLLYGMVRIAKYILNDGVSLKQVIDLGMMLRKIGDKVDFVKLQSWIEQLGMTDMAQLEGSLLKGLFNFSIDEIPFMSDKKSDDISSITHEIFRMKGNHTYDWYFTQGKNVFVSTSNKSAMMWHVNNSRRFFRYYPSETFTNFFTSFAHSISHIEE